MQDQFTFIHDAILESVTCGDTQISATNLRTRIAKMKRNDNKNQPHGFQYQFKVCRFCMVRGRYPLIFSLCRFWSRFLPTLRRFTVVGHSTARTETAVTNIFLVSFNCELGCLCNIMVASYIKSYLALFSGSLESCSKRRTARLHTCSQHQCELRNDISEPYIKF